MASLDVDGQAHLSLAEVFAEHGAAGLDNAALLEALFTDLLPKSPRESLLLVHAARIGTAARLTERIALGMPPESAVQDVGVILAETSLVDADSCRWAVAEFARVLGHPVVVPTVSVPSFSVPSVSAPPVSVPPVSAPPVSAPPVSGPPVSSPPVTAADIRPARKVAGRASVPNSISATPSVGVVSPPPVPDAWSPAAQPLGAVPPATSVPPTSPPVNYGVASLPAPAPTQIAPTQAAPTQAAPTQAAPAGWTPSVPAPGWSSVPRSPAAPAATPAQQPIPVYQPVPLYQPTPVYQPTPIYQVTPVASAPPRRASSAPASVHLVSFLFYFDAFILLAAAVTLLVLEPRDSTWNSIASSANGDVTTARGQADKWYLAVVAGLVLFAVFDIVLARSLQRGRQWARVFVLLICGLIILAAALSALALGSAANDALGTDIVYLVVSFLCIILLSLKNARSWFRYGTF